MGTFAALAFEALILSLAIADRFRLIRRQLEVARQRREIDLAETKALRLAAHTDFLTGLGNRAAFQEQAQALIGKGTPFSLFLIDVDYLKDVNDRLGHALAIHCCAMSDRRWSGRSERSRAFASPASVATNSPFSAPVTCPWKPSWQIC